ncbi:unnamed protein product [Prorocentrum cordatum]|uniref:Uncharacterized protein n=1 Tax=Prorocentrum cordatum TaxID=2364126 RepID=A0ABN9P9L9_9DINO|nr:unnamed protein product [Polarella glacialis]
MFAGAHPMLGHCLKTFWLQLGLRNPKHTRAFCARPTKLPVGAPVSQMARLLGIASLVGARGATGLSAAPQLTASSMMQFGAAVDKSSASQQAAAAFAERRTTTYIDLTSQTVWKNSGYHSTFNQNGTMTLGTESNTWPMWAPKTSALNLPDPSCTWTLEVGFHITSYSEFKYMSIGFGDDAAIKDKTWHGGNYIVFQEWSQQEGTARDGLRSEGSETNWNQMSLGEFFGNPSSKKYIRISYRADRKIDFQILSADRSHVLFSRVYWVPDNVGWPENVLDEDRSLVQFTVGRGVTTWSELSVEHSGTCPSPPTPAPTPAATSEPTPPPAGGAGAGASAVGDPHLQNIHGERFDLMKAGKHVLLNIPRGTGAESSLLRVQADARRLGGHCADIYFQELNVTGSWAYAEQAGGYHYSVSQRDIKTPGWATIGKVELKVVRGHTDSGLQYLNMHVKHLGRAGFAVGGLLGEDDHDDVSTVPDDCAQHLSLAAGTRSDGSPAVASVAVASLA